MANEINTTGENAISEVPASDQTGYLNLLDGNQLNLVFKNAKILSESQLLPDTFRGKAADVMILMDLAMRMKVSLFTLANHAYLVHGKVGISGQLCVALINGCGRFTPFTPIYVGEPGTREYGCYGMATRLSDNMVLKSTTITLGMATDEGWMRNSKWKTMTDQMLAYRAAAFFARVYCPDVLLGAQLSTELEDTYGEEKQKQKTRITLDDVIIESEVVE